jgi:hypothetical protein
MSAFTLFLALFRSSARMKSIRSGNRQRSLKEIRGLQGGEIPLTRVVGKNFLTTRLLKEDFTLFH